MFKAMLTKDSRILLFGDEDRPTACVHVEKKNITGYIGMLTVDPKKQSNGIGSFVLKTAESFIKKEFQVDLIQMWASIDINSFEANKVN